LTLFNANIISLLFLIILHYYYYATYFHYAAITLLRHFWPPRHYATFTPIFHYAVTFRLINIGCLLLLIIY
jgi:hypothetical protein